MRRAHVFVTRVHVWFPRDGECYGGRKRNENEDVWARPCFGGVEAKNKRAKKTEPKRDECWGGGGLRRREQETSRESGEETHTLIAR